MFQLYKLIRHNRTRKTLREDAQPIGIDFGNGSKPAVIYYTDGNISTGSCIHCLHPPCTSYSQEELKVASFPEFPLDMNNQVCPTQAITYPADKSAPVIDGTKCISCGLCVSRCPVAAISFDTEAVPVVNDEPNEYFISEEGDMTEELVVDTLARFSEVGVEGILIEESDKHLSRVFNQITAFLNTQSQFPNHLARNLLMGVGIKTAMRRRGDTNVRMDLVLEKPGIGSGTAEVEFTDAVIDTPRNILDNIAILVSRYNHKKEDIFPLIVGLSVPNKRTDYWQVIKDIQAVLDIRISLITIGALILLVWNRQSLDLAESNDLEVILGRNLDHLTGYPGLIKSVK